MKQTHSTHKEPLPSKADSLRLNPQKRLCPQYDSSCIALYPVAKRDKMGFRVIDDCCEEHIM